MNDTIPDEMNIMKQAFASATQETFKHRSVKPRVKRPKRVKPAPVRRASETTNAKMAGRGFTSARVICDALPIGESCPDELRELAQLVLEDTDTFHIEGRCAMTPVIVRAEYVSNKVLTTSKIYKAVAAFVNKYLNVHKFAFKRYYHEQLENGSKALVYDNVCIQVSHVLKNRYRFTVSSGETIRYIDLHM